MIIILTIIILYGLFIYLYSLNDYDKDCDYLIILGSKLDNNQISYVLKNRLNKAYDYYLKHPNCKIIVSGGICHDNTISEAEMMYKYLLDLNIDSSNIIIENKAKDTIENFKYSLLYTNKEDIIVVISSRYHLLRSTIIAKKLGYDVKSIGSNTTLINTIYHLLLEEIFIIKNY